eukprot:3631392-Pleurochrysis_carterae.AAC.1
MTGPHAEQSVGFRQGSNSTAPVMTEQAFTLAMGDLRLDVSHEERSSLQGVAGFGLRARGSGLADSHGLLLRTGRGGGG